MTRSLSCCSVERGDSLSKPSVGTLNSASAGRLPITRNESEATNMSGKSPSAWGRSFHMQGLLQESEERQRLQLQKHQEAMASLVEGMRDELMKRLGEMAATNKPRPPPLPPKDKVMLVPSAQVGQTYCEPPVAADDTVRQESKLRASNGLDQRFGGLNSDLMLTLGASRPHNHIDPIVGAEVVPDAQQIAPTSKLQGVLLQLVHSPYFQAVTAVIIMSYTVLIGVQADLGMRMALVGEDIANVSWKRWTDLSFAIAFAIEVLLRLLGEQLWYFKGPNRAWNIFDAVLVFTIFVEILDILQFNLSLLRVIRTLRAVRVLRVIRIFRLFRELRLMAAAIISCLVSLSWAFVLLFVVMYIFAVVLLQGAVDYLNSSEDVDTDLETQLAGDFSDLWRTIYSLILAVSGGQPWGQFSSPYIKISPWYGLAFMLFVVFVVFGVLNILTGVFVESTHSLASTDKELVMQEEMSHNESVINQIRHLFHAIDVDHSGTITLKELNRNLDDPRVKAYFSVLQMDVGEAQGLFQLLDKDESGEVSIEEFIFSCMRLKGAARSIDLAAVLFENKRLYGMVRGFMVHTDKMLCNIQNAVSQGGVEPVFWQQNCDSLGQ